MNYIVFDMEWNQAGFGRPMVREPLPLEGEIIQIGAVRLTEELEKTGEFTVNIRPRVYRSMNKRVQQITHISNADLKKGLSFAEASEQFRAFCGEDFALVTWGADDMRVLRQNLAFKACDARWIPEKNYDLQLVYDKLLGNSNESALGAALEKYEIALEEDRPQHNALNDAYYTALVFRRLGSEPLKELYSAPLIPTRSGELKKLPVTARGARKKALLSPELTKMPCPYCEKELELKPWAEGGGGRCLSLGRCPEHGDFFLRLRMHREEDGFRGEVRIYPQEEKNVTQYEELANAPKKRRHPKESGRPAPA